MKLVTLLRDTPHIGTVIESDMVVDLQLTYAAIRSTRESRNHHDEVMISLFSDMLRFISSGDVGLRAADECLDFVLRQTATSPLDIRGPSGETLVTRLQDTRLLAPLPKPPKLIMIGVNYRGHAKEYNVELPEFPWTTLKFPSTVTGPGQPIIKHRLTSKLDGEVELAFVIGRGGRNIRIEEARDHVFGFTVINDVTARDIQFEGEAGQMHFTLGKNADTFAPLGPCIVSASQLPDPYTSRIQLRINGVPVQDGNTAEMVLTVEQLISAVSRYLTLVPGDTFSTGTPERLPSHRFLEPGDIVAAEVEKIGVLENPVVSGDARDAPHQ